nr:MAG TPA: hypothetical protein [Caudoviricetes sp.]
MLLLADLTFFNSSISLFISSIFADNAKFC